MEKIYLNKSVYIMDGLVFIIIYYKNTLDEIFLQLRGESKVSFTMLRSHYKLNNFTQIYKIKSKIKSRSILKNGHF
jgi:hypothetical protein